MCSLKDSLLIKNLLVPPNRVVLSLALLTRYVQKSILSKGSPLNVYRGCVCDKQYTFPLSSPFFYILLLIRGGLERRGDKLRNIGLYVHIAARFPIERSSVVQPHFNPG